MQLGDMRSRWNLVRRKRSKFVSRYLDGLKGVEIGAAATTGFTSTQLSDAFRDKRARLQAEIHQAEQSLAETESRLQLDGDMLRMALELAEDVAAVYAQADEATKRGYNQAFFSKLYVEPAADEDGPIRAIKVTRAELTEPYTALLADNLVSDVLSEVESIRAQTERTEDDPDEPSSAALCSNFVKLAEGEGFEPSRPVNPA